MQCLRSTRLSMTSCDKAISWSFDKFKNDFIRPRAILNGAEWCMERRVDLGDSTVTTLAKCSNSSRQLWRLEDAANAPGHIHILGSTPGWGATDACLDNMQ